MDLVLNPTLTCNLGAFVVLRGKSAQKTFGNAPGKINAWHYLNYVMAVKIAKEVLMKVVTCVPKIFAQMSLTDGSVQESHRYLKPKSH